MRELKEPERYLFRRVLFVAHEKTLYWTINLMNRNVLWYWVEKVDWQLLENNNWRVEWVLQKHRRQPIDFIEDATGKMKQARLYYNAGFLNTLRFAWFLFRSKRVTTDK